MNNSLSEKIGQIKDEHAVEKLNKMTVLLDENSQREAAFLLGRITQNDHIAQAISSNLYAQSIRAMERFFEEKRHEALGFSTLVEFLDKSPLAPMSKAQYYDRLALVREHGDEIYDLLTAVGISVRSQKLLGKGDLSIKGDTLMIGDKEVEIANTGIIKDVLNELFDEKRELQRTVSKHHDQIEKLTEQIQTGQAEFNQLQRTLDAIRADNPYERSFARAVYALLDLTEMIGQLPEEQKASRGTDQMPLLWAAIQQIKAAYGTKYNFEDKPPSTQSLSDLEQIAAEVLDGDDDLDDDE